MANNEHPVKATIENCDTKQKLKCLFNPSEYVLAKSNSWQPKKATGKNVPQLDFTGGGSATLTLQLFFDVYEQNGDVRDYTNHLWDLAMIDEGKKNPSTKRSRPPLCVFQWGTHWSFKAVITSLSIRYTLFKDDGTPVRATADVTFQQAEDEKDQPGTNPTSFAEPGYKQREVRPRDTLATIAYEEYGDAGQWRVIALANNLDNPQGLHPGQLLAIPPLS